MAIPSPLPPEVEQLVRYRNSVYEFACSCVNTLDNVDRWQPIKPFPQDKPYLPWVMQQMVEQPLFAIVKHRRMFITWGMCVVMLHDAMFFEGRFNALVSKKEEDSDELVRRCKFIYDNIPPNKLILKPKATYKYTELRFPEIDSLIKGVAQGEDQLRQYTCTRVGCDEFAMWPKAKQTFVALKPTLEGGGKVTIISTRYPGFFKDLVEDTVDPDD